MIAVTFGIWYLAVAVGNKLAGTMGGMIDEISAQHGLSKFFMIFTFVPFAAGVMIILLGPLLRKLMHGVK
jgi:POT family proton-dependent oligopeptide transporter